MTAVRKTASGTNHKNEIVLHRIYIDTRYASWFSGEMMERIRRNYLMLMAALMPLVASSSGCTESGASTSTGQVGQGEAGGAGGAGGGIDTSAWDCSAKSFPERKSPVPANCATDPTCMQSQVSWHRGAGEMGIATFAPEETLSALRAALELGADMLGTIDPRPTKDGVLIAMQDDTVNRITQGQGNVADFTLAELQSLALRTDAYSGDFSCERVTTYREILQNAKGRIVVLSDLSSYGSAVGLVVADIQAADAIDWVLFGAQTLENAKAALALEPKLHVWINVESAADLDMKLTALAPVIPAFAILKMGSSAELDAVAKVAHDRGTRALTLVFTNDAIAKLTGDMTSYDATWKTGVDAVISNRVDFALHSLGR